MEQQQQPVSKPFENSLSGDMQYALGIIGAMFAISFLATGAYLLWAFMTGDVGRTGAIMLAGASVWLVGSFVITTVVILLRWLTRQPKK